jgi:hypothetical protein
MKKNNFNQKRIIDKTNINEKSMYYIYNKVLKYYSTHYSSINIDSLNSDRILNFYLSQLDKYNTICSKITVISIQNIKNDIKRIMELNLEILKLKETNNPDHTLLVTNIKIESNIKVDFDIRYLIYIQKYGVSVDGTFDMELLNNINIEEEMNSPVIC